MMHAVGLSQVALWKTYMLLSRRKMESVVVKLVCISSYNIGKEINYTTSFFVFVWYPLVSSVLHPQDRFSPG